MIQNFIVVTDPRTKDWFLVHSPWPPLIILITYILFCINAKRIMNNRREYELRIVLIVYNFALVALSCYMTYEVRIINVKFVHMLYGSRSTVVHSSVVKNRNSLELHKLM